jgi:hypothetical protein
MKRYTFSAKEIAVIITITLAACVVPSAGLMRCFTCAMVLPHQYNKTNPGWKENAVLDMVPKKMLVDVTKNENDVLNGFIQGMGVGNKHVSPAKVPWYAWVRMLMFWLPIVLALWTALIGLSMVIHKHWVHHELLPYPIAVFTNTLLPDKDNRQSSIFRNPLFWLGTGFVFVIHFNNYLFQWFPRYLLDIPINFDFQPFANLFPALLNAGGGWLFYLRIFFSAIGIGYFLATDVSLSLGIAPLAFYFLTGVLMTYGISLNGSIEGASGYLDLKIQTFALAGAYFATFLVLLYTGRNYYLSIIKQTFKKSITEESDTDAVWGARIFFVFIAVFIFQIIVAGIDWQLAIMYAGITVIIFLVMSRIIAETGLFYMQPFHFPCVILWGLFGSQVLGPQTLLLMFLITTVILIDPRESLMPYIVNSFKLVDLQDIKISKIARWCVVSILFGIMIALPVTLYFQYDRGYSRYDGWAFAAVPPMAYSNVVNIKQKLTAQGILDQSEKIKGWDRFIKISPTGPCMAGFGAGLILVLAFTLARLYWAKWPLHPIIFLVWSTHPSNMFYFSFLMGWLCKVIVTKYGGIQTYHKIKPVFIGLIAGEVLAAVVFMIIGFAYFYITGESPKFYMMLPG